MWFNSLPFFWLLLATFVAYYTVRGRVLQVGVLLVASLIFYGWTEPTLLALLLASVLLNALTSYRVAAARSQRQKVAWATVGVVLNVLVLAFFKYAGLAAEVVGRLLEPGDAAALKHLLTLPLPIGISFYTFEGISLLVDTYTGKVKPLARGQGFLQHWAETSLFVAFFPHLVAGPILKANQFLPQIGPRSLSEVQWGKVMRTLIQGYFLKCVVADNLKDHTFWLTYPECLNLGSVNGLVLTLGYSVQIFADFAGYSLIAIGLGAAFGYELPVNFHYPYIATSLKDFWRRWHISLSTWLRDYLYLPLGGNRCGPLRTYFNLFLVMLLGGLWHGAAWSYVVWGAYHGLGLALERLVVEELAPRLPARGIGSGPAAGLLRALGAVLRLGWVFVFVTFGWLLFKLTDLQHAWEFVQMMAVRWRSYLNTQALAAVLLYSLPVFIMHALHLPSTEGWWVRIQQRWVLVEDVALGLMLAALFVNRGSSYEFIYFQF
jgi:alginate O-acetyltransferase complex protein AlgI